jgi:hypothetical protein
MDSKYGSFCRVGRNARARPGGCGDAASPTEEYQAFAIKLFEGLACDDLATWTVIWSSTGAQNVAGDVEVTDSEFKSADTNRFLRLRITNDEQDKSGREDPC